MNEWGEEWRRAQRGGREDGELEWKETKEPNLEKSRPRVTNIGVVKGKCRNSSMYLDVGEIVSRAIHCIVKWQLDSALARLGVGRYRGLNTDLPKLSRGPDSNLVDTTIALSLHSNVSN